MRDPVRSPGTPAIGELPTMSPIVILVVALLVVVGGVLAFRLHAFLVLIVGALVVAALTPSGSVARFELGKDAVPVSSLNEDGTTANVRDRKRQLLEGALHPVYRLTPGHSPRRIAEVTLTPVADGARGEAGWLEARVTWVEPGENLRPGDGILPPASAKAAARVAGLPLGQRVAEGFGRTALDIGILIAMASILGTCLMAARGAERIVLSMQRAIGTKRTPLAFLGSGFLLGIPMFAEAVFYLLLPLAKAMWSRTHARYVLHVLAIVAGATMTHSLVPPTPGPLFVAHALGVPLAVMMLQGCLVGAVAALAGYGYAVWADRRWPIPLREPPAEVRSPTAPPKPEITVPEPGAAEADLPPLFLSLLPILLPVVLISAASALESHPAFVLPGWAKSMVRVLGDKNLALTVSAGMAMLLLALRKSGGAAATRGAIRTAVVEAGEIILVISAGGALGQTLRQAGMADLAGAVVPDWKLALLPIAWAVTALIRVAQGSATVAMITAVGIVAPLAETASLGYHAVYLALAIGCGSKVGMWMNDSGFWVISKMSGLTEGETLKTASAMVLWEGCVGLGATLLLATIWPMG